MPALRPTPMLRTVNGIAFQITSSSSSSTGAAARRLPVLLVHGHFGSRATLVPATAAAVADRDVVSLDLPWHGDSPAGAREDIAVAVDAVVDVLDTLGWDRCIAIGHSWGAQVLLAARARFADRFALQVTIGLPGDPDDDDRAGFNGLADTIVATGVDVLVPIALDNWYAPAFLEREPTTATRLQADLARIGAANVAAVLRTYANGAPLLPTLNAAGPAVVSIVARGDRVIPVGKADALHAAVAAHVVEVDGGHFFFEEDPAVLAPMLAAVLRDR